MNQSYKATLSQYALPQFLPTWGGKGGVIWEDLEVCSLKTMMFEKYPSISPYTYCANNPMKFVDPTGEEIAIVGDENYQKAVGKILLNIYNSGIAGKFLVTQAIKSKKTFVIADTKQGIECGIHENKNASVLPFNLEEANGTYEEKDGGAKFTAESTLAHELAHFVFPQNGFLLKDGKSTLIRAGEVAAVEWENRVRKDLGMGMRKKYDGMYVYGKEIISSKYNGYYNLKDKENYGNTNFSVPSQGNLQISTEKRGTYYMYGGYFDKYLNNPGSKTQKRLKF